MIRKVKFPVKGKNRREIREELVKAFLLEEPGTGTGDLCSVYHYEVEQLCDGKIVFLKRPARLNKGFDFEVNVSETIFGTARKTTRPSHRHILEDLEAKMVESPKEFETVKILIERIYNCENIPCEEMRALKFEKGHSIEAILKAIKWLFIEQDITYWNWTGREMFYSGIKELY